MPHHLTTANHDENIVDGITNAIIDFSAVWCGPCKKMAPFFAKAESFVQSINLDVKFFEVDVDTSVELAKKYNINAMPTLILIKNGQEIERSRGFMDDQGILTLIGKHFDLPMDKGVEESESFKSSESCRSSAYTDEYNSNQN